MELVDEKTNKKITITKLEATIQRLVDNAVKGDHHAFRALSALTHLLDDPQNAPTLAELEGRKYSHILEKPYRWESWAAPKDKDRKLDHNNALSGDDLRDFVNQKLFPYLHKFKEKASASNTIEYKIGEIFGEIKNKIQSGYNLREIIDHIDELQFRSQKEKDELSHLYEAKIRNMGNAGRNGGEYYTPRPLIRAIVQVVKPQIGDHIYDGAVGSAGFLCESYEYLKKQAKTTKDMKTLQERTFQRLVKNAVETYELTIDELQIARIQRECPTMVILRNEVQRIAERTGQGFRIEASDSGKNIWVPKELEGYEEVKALLLSTTPAQASTMRYPLAITYGASLLVIAGFFIVMWSKQRMLVTTAGIVVLCLFTYSAVQIAHSWHNLSRQTRRGVRFLALPILAVIGRIVAVWR